MQLYGCNFIALWTSFCFVTPRKNSPFARSVCRICIKCIAFRKVCIQNLWDETKYEKMQFEIVVGNLRLDCSLWNALNCVFLFIKELESMHGGFVNKFPEFAWLNKEVTSMVIVCFKKNYCCKVKKVCVSKPYKHVIQNNLRKKLIKFKVWISFRCFKAQFLKHI